VCGCSPWLSKSVPHPYRSQFLDFIAAGPLTRPECGAGGESTPSGATGARESVQYVSRRSSWTPLLARLGGLFAAFLSTQLSAYIDSWFLVSFMAICCCLKTVVLCVMQPDRRSAARTMKFFQTPVGDGPACLDFTMWVFYSPLLHALIMLSFPIHRSYALLCSCVDADVKRTDSLWACPLGLVNCLHPTAPILATGSHDNTAKLWR
jgi:hypothetical protein